MSQTFARLIRRIALITLAHAAFAYAGSPVRIDMQITEITLPPGATPWEVVTTIDGTVWYTGLENHIGRINPNGTVDQFTPPTADSEPHGIAIGPDGNIWFTELKGNKIGRISASGEIKEFPLPENRGPYAIIAGKSELWFTEFSGNRIGRMNVDGSLTEFAIPTEISQPQGLTIGRDGAIWFVENNGNKIGRISLDGKFREIAIPTGFSQAVNIAADTAGNLWFTELEGAKYAVLDAKGAITEYEPPSKLSGPLGIAIAPGGDIWITEYYHSNIVFLPKGNPAKAVEIALPTKNELHPAGITIAKNGTIWIAEMTNRAIAKIVPKKPKSHVVHH